MNNTMNSNSIRQVLEVIQGMVQGLRGGETEGSACQNAIRAVSQNHNVTYQTIGDGCSRRLGIRIDEFHTLVVRAVDGDGRNLKSKLIAHAQSDGEQLIEAFFRNEFQIQPAVGDVQRENVHDIAELIRDFGKKCRLVLDDYPSRPHSRSSEAPVFIRIRDLGEQFEQIAQRLVVNNHWMGKASSGSGDSAFTPWIAVFDTRITRSASGGEYPVIHFLFNQEGGSPHGPGIRLGLGISTNQYRGNDRSNRVMKVTRELRNLIEDRELRDYWFADSTEQRPTLEPSDRNSLGHGYYDGMVMEKFIEANVLGSLDNQFEQELEFLFEIYKRWIESSLQDTPPVNSEYTLADLARNASIDRDVLERWISAINRKGQAILYGPPGTGKTYTARLIAKYLSQQDGSEGSVDLVQFHPAYTYEDFMQGLRPVSEDGQYVSYPVKPGRFLDFCNKARGKEGICVLIIDEINRANLSEVFGELMFLLEYRDESVALAVDGTNFDIPSNVRLLGTMNTADRSIALVDHALRRRFAFLRLSPNYQLLRNFHIHTGFAVDGLVTLLQRLNTAIDDPHFELGVSFFLGPNLVESIQDTWQMEIEPYLEEYFFDHRETVEDFRWDRVQGTVLET